MRFWNTIGGVSIGASFLVAGACVGDDPNASAPVGPCTPSCDDGRPGVDGGPGEDGASSSSLLMSVDRPDVTIGQGAAANLKVSIQRVTGAASAVHVDATSPTGLLVPAVTIAADATTAMLEIDAKTDAHVTGATPAVVTLTARADSGETATATVKVTIVGAPGVIDTTFATNGVGVQSFGGSSEQPKCMVVDTSDRILVGGMSGTQTAAGNAVLARFTPDGILDTTFAAPNGYVMGPAGFVANACALAPDGSIVMSGTTGAYTTAAQDFAVIHVLASGTFDATFGPAGAGGMATKDFAGGADTSSGVVVLADGTIVATGFSADLGTNPAHEAFAAVRLTAAGVAGTAVVQPRVQNLDYAAGAALAMNGDVLVMGSSGPTYMISDVTSAMVQSLSPTTLTRDTASFGTGQGYFLDSSFGTTQFYGGNVAVGADGKIVVVGGGYSNGASLLGGFRVLRYTKAGLPDATFAGGGHTTFNVGTSNSAASDAAIAADGKVIVAGSAQNTQMEGNDFALLRLAVDGTLDATFHGDGKLFIPVAPGSGDSAVSVRLQKEGRIVVAGSTYKAGAFHWALARVWP